MSESSKKITAEEGKIAFTFNDYGIQYNWNSREFKREERAKNGELKSYWPDFVVPRNLVGRESRFKSLILQIEGEGSASKDNEKMDAFFAALDYLVLHIPNSLANNADFRIILAKILGWSCGTDRAEVLHR